MDHSADLRSSLGRGSVGCCAVVCLVVDSAWRLGDARPAAMAEAVAARCRALGIVDDVATHAVDQEHSRLASDVARVLRSKSKYDHARS